MWVGRKWRAENGSRSANGTVKLHDFSPASNPRQANRPISPANGAISATNRRNVARVFGIR